MKTHHLVFFLVVLSITTSLSQSVDYNKIILPDNATNVSFEERLVQLAWKNNPQSHAAGELVNQRKEELKVIGATWTSTVGVTGNLNEFNIKDLSNGNSNQSGNVFFPRYNFYVQLPLSLLTQTPRAKKAARYKTSIAEDEVKLLKLELRSTVLKLYSDYKTNELIFLIKKQSMADEESNYLLVEQKFKNGDALIEEYLKVQRSRNDWKVQLAISENQFLKSKYELEEVIGVKIEDVM